jgi:hypothetical protein
MIAYQALYKFVEGGVHAQVLDFLGVITRGADLREAREMLASGLVDMAETHLMEGESLPRPDPMATDPESDIEEPIYLLLTAASQVQIIPLPAR